MSKPVTRACDVIELVEMRSRLHVLHTVAPGLKQGALHETMSLVLGVTITAILAHLIDDAEHHGPGHRSQPILCPRNSVSSGPLLVELRVDPFSALTA